MALTKYDSEKSWVAGDNLEARCNLFVNLHCFEAVM
jgi:hypothetical protein